MEQIDVSVIVTTRNEENNLPACLDSVRRQTHPADRIEIIVVDNDSTDATKEVARRFTPLVYNRGPERSAQRNYGISLSRGRYVLYLDADMRLSENVIFECVDTCDRERLIALYIPERIVGEGFWVKVRDFERSFYNATCVDAVRFFRKDSAVAIGGFDENLNGPEDWDFDRRIRNQGRVAIGQGCLHHHEGTFHLPAYLRKKRYYARGFESYRRKWGRRDLVIRKQLGFGYRMLGVFLEGGKWKRIFAHPGLGAGMMILRAGVGLTYIRSRWVGRK